VLGILIAIWLSAFGGGVFQYIQTLNAFFAPPFAAIFVLGLLTRSANSTGALFAILGGFGVGVALKILGGFVTMPGWFYPFANQAAITWVSSLALCVLGSALPSAKARESRGQAVTLWDSAAMLREGLGEVWWQSPVLWSAGFVIAIMGVMYMFSDAVFPAR
jgi:solute:Na+ symporter, SSS family